VSLIKVVWGAIVSPTRQRGLSSLPRWRVGLTKTKRSVRPRSPADRRPARTHRALLDDRFRNFGMRSIRTAAAPRLIVQHTQAPPRAPLAPLRNDDRSRALQERAHPAGDRRLYRVWLVLGLVADDLAFEVTQDDRVVARGDQVVRHDRDLAAAVRAVHHVRRDTEARHMAAETLHDLDPLPHRRAEVARPDDRIAVEDIVRPDFDP